MRNQVQLITYPDRISNDLAGLREVLDHELDGLFGGVHILPFFTPHDGADAGFDPADHTQVDPRLGDWSDIARIAERYEVMADVIVNLAEEGNGFPWHFDTNNYTVTLAIQNAEAGGDFEYSPYLRTPTDENYEGVERVLDGDQSLIRTLRLEPGDLQIFKGRYSLHRVTPLVGQRLRYVAIFSYVEEAGMVAQPERAQQLYGRVLPIHFERAGLRADSLVD